MNERELLRGFCILVAYDKNLNVVVHPNRTTERIVKIGLDYFLGGAHIGGTFGVLAGFSLAMFITMKMRRRYKSVADIIKNELTLSQIEKLLSTVERCTRSNLIQKLDSGTEMDLKDAITMMIMEFMRAELNYEETVSLPRDLY